ncbi:hypothetical protein OAF74_02005 [bacterium]|jgi:hypothetical protein|nr:hypothetical protein [Planctomicrobium sp.]MDB4731591.1 hypothetical protein [bacterium]
MDFTTLTERCQNWNENLSVDQSKRMITQVALTGGLSRNGYSYSNDALQNAVPLYEGKPVFLDHATNRSRPEDRSTRDLVGSIANPTFKNGRIYGDIKVLETESGQTFLKLLELETPGVGMSHVVKAKRSVDGTIVEEIADVISVDAVVNPATTSTFKESVNSIDEIDEQRIESIRLLNEQVSQLETEQQSLLSENQQLKDQLAAMLNKGRVHKLINQFSLPDQAVTDFFVQQLESTSDAAIQEQMIQDRLAIISATGERTPVVHSQERTSHSNAPSTDDLFISSFRRK